MRKRKWKKEKEFRERWFDGECKKKKEELIETIRKAKRGEIRIVRRKKETKEYRELLENKKEVWNDRWMEVI